MTEFVMIVEDDTDLRESLGNLLKDEGHTVVSLSNGREALDYLRASPTNPCLILLDLMMPVMDGRDFRREQLNDPALKDIPVVLITAAGAKVSATVNATAILNKPLASETVLDTVERLC
jgi:CheY-like chemotaxis protein